MKRTLLFLSVFAAYFGFSQDTIYTKSGSVINAKVTEINQDEIKYKKSNNPDGPTYVVDKNEVALIEYKNGTKDVFSREDNSNNSTAQSNTNDTYNNGPYYSRPGTNIIITPRPYFWIPRPRVYVRWRPFYGPRIRVHSWWW